MKKVNKLLILIALFLITLSSIAFANNTEYVIKKSMTFKNQKKYELTGGFIEVALGQFDFTQYDDDLSFKITPAPSEIKEDKFGNKYAYYDITGMRPDSELKIVIERRVVPNTFEKEISVRTNSVINDELKIYVEPQERIESDDAKIIAKAKELTEDISSDYKKALAIFEYVNTKLTYDTNTSYANKGALSALENNRGVCEEFASLYVAMCRAVNIPSRVVEGYKIDKKDIEGEEGEYTTKYEIINHTWAEINLDGFGFLPVEPTIIYMVGNERVAYREAFLKMDEATYIPIGVYNYEKPNRTMQYVTETSFKEEILLASEIKEQEIKFEDIPESFDWSRESIEKLYKLGIINGYSEFEFGPERNISRIESICMISRMLKFMNQPSVKRGLVYYYLDYDQSHYSKPDYDYLMRCYQAITPSDIVSAGYYNMANIFGSSFDMNRPITRAEVVALMDVFMKDNPTENIFSDIDGNRFSSSILKSYSNGLITGYPDGTFKPNGAITRAEMAVILNRYIGETTYELEL